MTLYLVCETSGSMAEGGKNLIMRGVVRAVEQYYRLGYGKGELKLIAWNDTAGVVEWIADNEYPPQMLDCKGAANAESLIVLLGEQPDGKILLITDGFWRRDAAKIIKRWKNGLPPDILRVIRIGADANPQLKGKDVFPVEDLFAALDNWPERVII